MNRCVRSLSLLPVLLVFIALASTYATQQSLWVDEATQLTGLEMNFLNQLKWLVGINSSSIAVPGDRMPPLSYWLGTAWGAALGGSELSYRYMSICLAVVAITGIYYTTRKYFGLTAAMTASMLLATSPNLLVQSVEIRPYSLFIATAVLAIYWLLRVNAQYYCDPESSRLKTYLLLLAVACSAVILTHYYGAVLTASVFITFTISAMLHSGNQNILTILKLSVPPCVVLTITLLFIAPFINSAATQSGETIEFMFLDYARSLARLLYRFFAHQSMLQIETLNVFVSISGIMLVVIAAVRGAKNRHTLILTLCLLLGIMIPVLAGLKIRGFDTLKPSYNVWLLPITFILISSLVSDQDKKYKFAGSLLIGVLLLGNLVSTYQLIADGDKYAHTRSIDLKKVVQRYGLSEVMFIYDDVTGKTYLPLNYWYRNKLRHFSYLENQQLQNAATFEQQKFHLSEINSTYVVVVRGEDLNANELAYYIKLEIDPKFKKSDSALNDFLNSRYELLHQKVLLARESIEIRIFRKLV